jgi:hypothetical protein
VWCTVSRPSVDSTSAVKTGAVQSTLPKLTTVMCAKAGLTVALRRDLLENFGVRRSQLSLAERSCGATENATHFILHTSFTDCSTRVDVSDGAIVYVNRVFVYRSNVVAAQLEVQCATNIHTSVSLLVFNSFAFLVVFETVTIVLRALIGCCGCRAELMCRPYNGPRMRCRCTLTATLISSYCPHRWPHTARCMLKLFLYSRVGWLTTRVTYSSIMSTEIRAMLLFELFDFRFHLGCVL